MKVKEHEPMQPSIPLDEMTTTEKLCLLEEVWDALRCTPNLVPSPSWHAEVLKGRERRLQEGSSHFRDWNEAKQRLREGTKKLN
jgi:hypothetical protein